MKTKSRLLALLMLPFSVIAQPALAGEQPAETKEANHSTSLNLSANMENNQLSLSGKFENGNVYEVMLLDTHGRRIYSKRFIGSTTEQRFDISGNLNSGEYTVTVKDKGNIG